MQNEKVVIVEGDVHDYVKEIPDNSISLIITSPPYNLGKNYEKREHIEDYLNTQQKLLVQLHRILKEEGNICWQIGNYIEKGEILPLDVLYYPLFKQLNMKLRNRIVWQFGHGLHASKRLSGRYEIILWFSKSNNYTFNLDPIRIPQKYPGKKHWKGPNKGKLSCNPLGKNPGDVWNVLIQEWEKNVWNIPNVKANHPEKTIHPCQFPIELAERCILALSNENDWVFDPYMGVGSSILAAIMHNRRAIGCEKEKEYVEITKRRILLWQEGKLPHRPMGKPVYNP